MAEKGTGLPEISVLMPAYNAERYIEAAIRSLEEQTVENWELIVVDDCSTDGTAQLLRAWRQRIPGSGRYSARKTAARPPAGIWRWSNAGEAMLRCWTRTICGVPGSWSGSWPWRRKRGRTSSIAPMP